MARKYTLIAFFYLCLSFTYPYSVEGQGNKFIFDHLTGEGLSEGEEYLNSVRTIYQDHYGYIWIGLNTGLARYDGYEFTTYKQDRNDSSSFLGRMVTTFAEDINGDIWIGTQPTGVYHFKRATESFVQYSHDPEDISSISHNEILHLYPDSKGYIWCISDSRNGYLDRIDPKSRKVERFGYENNSDNDLNIQAKVHLDPGINTTAITEDNAGSVWFALKDGKGLGCYDYALDSIKYYCHETSNPNGLRSNLVYCVTRDNNDNIWIGTSEGLHAYSAETENFIYYPEISTSDYTGRKEIYKIYKDSRGKLWLIMYNEVVIFDPEENTSKTATIFPSVQRNYFDIIGEVPNKGIWIDLSNLTYEFYDFTQQKVTSSQNILLNQSIYEIGEAFSPVSSYLIDHSGLLWIAINLKGIYKEDEFIRTFDSYIPEIEHAGALTSTQMFNVCEDPQGKIWFTSNRGLFHFDRLKNTYHHIIPTIRGNLKFQDQPLRQIVSQRDGNLWINTLNNAILTFDSKKFNEESGVNIAMNKRTYSSSIEGPGVESLFAVDGDMTTRWSSSFSEPQWIYVDMQEPVRIDRIVVHWEYASGKDYDIQTSYDAVNWQTIYSVRGWSKMGRTDFLNLEGTGRYLRILCLERNTSFGFSIYEIEIYKKVPPYNHIKYETNKIHGIPSDTIYSIQKDSQDNIWLTSSKGLTIFDITSQNFNTFSFPGSADMGEFEFHEDSRGLFWLEPTLPSRNIINFNPLTETFHEWEFPDEENFIDNEPLQNISFYEDKNNRLWKVGNDFANGNYKIYLYHHLKDSFELKYNSLWNITGIIHEKEDLFWISLFARGIQLVDLERGEVLKTYDNTNGLNDLEIKSIERYQSENIWILYNDGICRFNPNSESFRNYNKQYGIQDIIFFNTLQSSSGHVYVPAVNGFNVFHPDSLRLNPNLIPPNVVIASFKIRDREITVKNHSSILEKHIANTREINLTSNQNVFTIGFTGFHYGLPEMNTYTVKMEGLDEEWNYIGSHREVSYTGLSAGDYIFRVKSANADGIWNDSGATLSVIIHPPWYFSWWSISSYVLIAFGLGYTFYRVRRDIHRKNLEIKQKEIDEHKRINERLKQVDELKDQFLANTSHELRTPLSGIIGLADSLKDGIAGKQSEKAIDFLEMITASGKRLSSLIDDILDFSKLKNNELKLLRKPVDVRSVTDIVITILQPLVRNKSVRLSNNIQTDAPLVFADENRLQQMLINLIGNAIKFTDEGSIVVSAEPKEDFLAISISDTGLGIPKDKLSEIFHTFEQLDMSISREYGGTGLGLAITKQLVELHEGTIEVDSEPGKGSTFTIFLPLSEGKISDLPELDEETKKIQVNRLKEVIDKPITLSEKTEIVAQEIVPKLEGEQINILIVDDEPVNLQVLDNYLSFAGYKVTKAKNGIVALDLLADNKKFDLVILDVMMPKMSGYEVCNKLREIYLPNELPIIMLTVRNTVADMVCGLNCGANDYLIKPFSKEELLSRVKTHLNLHRINRIANRFVPMKFLQSIGKNSIMEVKLGDYANLEVTVFFSDIRKYTAISESMSPEDNFRFIHAYVKRMGPIIHKHSGFINQYMGDAIMAIFPEETHYSLNAAIYMQRKIGEYNKERILKGRNPIVVGMGLHCGSLTMGIIGDENRSEPSTIADTVNIAARIEQLTKYYGARILFSENSYNNLPEAHRYHIRYLGNVHVKGKKEILKVFECFDGDDDEMIKLKMKSISDFDIALKQFYNKDFPEAAVGFKKILKGNKGDQVVQNFYNHSVKFSHEGVPENWSGVEIIDSSLL